MITQKVPEQDWKLRDDRRSNDLTELKRHTETERRWKMRGIQRACSPAKDLEEGINRAEAQKVHGYIK